MNRCRLSLRRCSSYRSGSVVRSHGTRTDGEARKDHQHGLVPGQEQDCVPPKTQDPATGVARTGRLGAIPGVIAGRPGRRDSHQVAVAASNLNNRGLSAQIEFLFGSSALPNP